MYLRCQQQFWSNQMDALKPPNYHIFSNKSKPNPTPQSSNWWYSEVHWRKKITGDCERWHIKTREGRHFTWSFLWNCHDMLTTRLIPNWPLFLPFSNAKDAKWKSHVLCQTHFLAVSGTLIQIPSPELFVVLPDIFQHFLQDDYWREIYVVLRGSVVFVVLTNETLRPRNQPLIFNL